MRKTCLAKLFERTAPHGDTSVDPNFGRTFDRRVLEVWAVDLDSQDVLGLDARTSNVEEAFRTVDCTIVVTMDFHLGFLFVLSFTALADAARKDGRDCYLMPLPSEGESEPVPLGVSELAKLILAID